MITIVNLISGVVPKGIVIMVLVGILRQAQGMRRGHVSLFPRHNQKLASSCSHRGLPSTFRRFGWSLSSFSKVDTEDSRSNSGSSQSVGGTIIARIMPQSKVDYECRKPRAKDDNVSAWRKRVVEPLMSNSGVPSLSSIDLHLPNLSRDDETDEWNVCLDVDLRTTLDLEVQGDLVDTDQLIQVKFKLHRLAFETADRTLERLYLSSKRKIASAAMPYQKSRRKASLSITQSSSSTTGMSSSHDLSEHSSSISYESGAHTSIWISDDEQSNKIRPYNVDSDMLGVDLWKHLANYPNRCTIVLNTHDDGSPSSSSSSSPVMRMIPLKLESCPPTILSVSTFLDFQSDIFVGVPLCIETEVINAKRARTIWFVDDRQVLYDSAVYTPVAADVGKSVSVLITPVRTWKTTQGKDGTLDYPDLDEVYHFGHKVQPLPFLPIVNMRGSWLDRRSKQRDSDRGLRIMSYNLLADLYTSRELDQRDMYQHCDLEFLPKSRRMPLLVYEILAYQPDVVCLQEVDKSVFEGLFRPVFESQGYSGYYSNKASKQLEGCAMFWSSRCFEDEVKMEEFAVRDLIRSKSNKTWDTQMIAIHQFLDQRDDLKQVVETRVGTVLQIATLQLKQESKSSIKERPDTLVIGNTHLFYHPLADHVRCIQAYSVCKQLDMVRHEATTSDGSPSPFVLCGDLNSDPLSGALRLLLHREVESDHFGTWKCLDTYSWDKGEHEYMVMQGYVGGEADPDIDPAYMEDAFEDALDHEYEAKTDGRPSPPGITLPNCFPSLVSGYKEMPEFTNYAIDFAETLDYCFASGPTTESHGFESVASAPCPSSAEMKPYVAMPNEFMPSDHVSLVCDLRWRLPQETESAI